MTARRLPRCGAFGYFSRIEGIDTPTVRADLRNREHLQPGFRAVNPFCTVPALEPDDGTVLCSTAAIWRYLEETHPEPPAAVGIRCWYALVSSRPSSGA